MYIYYTQVPAAAVKRLFDGSPFAFVDVEMRTLPNGLQGARTCEPRILRVSHIDNGLAFLKIGSAETSRACFMNLPCSVQVQQVDDCTSIEGAAALPIRPLQPWMKLRVPFFLQESLKSKC
jgi:hypothetical protein